MDTKERILTIRLLEKLQTHPDYAKSLGIVVGNGIQAVADDEKGGR